MYTAHAAKSCWNSMWETIQLYRQESLQPAKSTTTTAAATSSGRHRPRRRAQSLAIGMGQLIALSSSSMNAASYTLIDGYKISTPMFQLFWMYVVLSSYLYFRKNQSAADSEKEIERPYHLPGTCLRLKIPWWIYFMISVLDIVPNFMAICSLRYTSLTNATLLGSLTVPSTMFFSRHILAKMFQPHHYIGVCLCILGGCLTVLSDYQGSTTTIDENASADLMETATSTAMQTFTYFAPLPIAAGDLLAIASALIYGLGDTVAEYSIKHIDREEYLGMLGVFGTLFTAILFPLLERDSLLQLGQVPRSLQIQISSVMIWYIASVLFYYVGQATFLISSDATLLNLSLQTSNLWAILFSVLAYREMPPHVFFVSLVLVVSGVFIYEVEGTRSIDKATEMEQLRKSTQQDVRIALTTHSDYGSIDGEHKSWEGNNCGHV